AWAAASTKPRPWSATRSPATLRPSPARRDRLRRAAAWAPRPRWPTPSWLATPRPTAERQPVPTWAATSTVTAPAACRRRTARSAPGQPGWAGCVTTAARPSLGLCWLAARPSASAWRRSASRTPFRPVRPMPISAARPGRAPPAVPATAVPTTPAARPQADVGTCRRARGQMPRALRLLVRVGVGGGGVGAAGGGGEVEVAGAGLGEGPAGELLDDVVDAAAGAQIARAGAAALGPGGGVVQVCVPGGLAAAGVAAGLVAGGDVVAEGGAGAVGGGGGGVGAPAGCGGVGGGLLLGAGVGAAGGAQHDSQDPAANTGPAPAGAEPVQGGGGDGDGDVAGYSGRAVGAVGARASARAGDSFGGGGVAVGVGDDHLPVGVPVGGGDEGERECLAGGDGTDSAQGDGPGGVAVEGTPGDDQVQQVPGRAFWPTARRRAADAGRVFGWRAIAGWRVAAGWRAS